MKFLIMVNSSPWGSSRSGLALRFLRAALAQEHEVMALYFRGDGVYHCLGGEQTDAGAEPLHEVYQELALRHDFPLWLCSAAMSRRFPQSESPRESPRELPWIQAGLAQWVTALDDADRVVTF